MRFASSLTRRQFTASAIAAGIGASASLGAAQRQSQSAKQATATSKINLNSYNIVVIKTEQQRADTINYLGHKHMITPNIDKLASKSVIFNNAFCCGATCVCSRAAFYTGRLPVNTGIYTFQNWADQPTWLDDFKENGYYLTAIGKNHHLPFDAPMAFDERVIVENFPMYEPWDDFSNYLEANNQPRPLKLLTEDGKWMDKCGSDIYPLEEKYFVDTFVGDNAVRWIDDYDRQKPFYLHIGFQGAHDPFTVPKRFLDMYDDVQVPEAINTDGGINKPKQYERFRKMMGEPLGGFDTPPIYGTSYLSLEGKSSEDIARMRKHYYARVTLIDEQVGRIMESLEKRGLADNTIVIFTSDHGDNLADHNLVYKWLMTEQATRVPMMVMLPKKLRRAAIDERLFTQLDVGPTLLDVCGITPATKLDGKSNKSRIVEGSTENVPEAVYCFKNYMTMMRTETEKVVNYAGQSYGEYYDLIQDPIERYNRYDELRHKANRLEAGMYSYINSLRFLGTDQPYSHSLDEPIRMRTRLYPQHLGDDPYRLH